MPFADIYHVRPSTDILGLGVKNTAYEDLRIFLSANPHKPCSLKMSIYALRQYIPDATTKRGGDGAKKSQIMPVVKIDVVRAMPLREQIRLHTELGKLVQVHLVQPDSSVEAMQQGQRLADEVRHELSTSLSGSTLEETMTSLRWRSWRNG